MAFFTTEMESVNTFAGGETFISGNRCDRPVTGKADSGERNLYAYKRKLILGPFR